MRFATDARMFSATVALVTATFLAGCVAPPVARDDAATRKQVAAASAAWVAAYNSRDPARIAAQYAPDAVFWGTTSPTIRATPAAIADYFKDAAKRPDARVKIEDEHIRAAGEMAFSSGTYTFSDVREGKAVANPSRFTFVFRNDAGRWILVHHHSSRMPAQ